MACRRLNSLRNKLCKDTQLRGAYQQEIQKLLDHGYKERVRDWRRLEGGSEVWYLPHHLVINPNKTGKMRTVFDCASTSKGQSLNSQAFQGLDINNQLLGILLHFQEGRVAVSADIEAMFYQVRVRDCDRDALRFLWQDDDKEPSIMCMKVHVFGGVWSPACTAFA